MTRAFVRGLVVALLVVVASPASAQVRPDLPWRTLVTRHFRVHFTPELEPLARRAATHAEALFERLALQMTPPRGLVDLVVTDHVDYANGSATPWPSNRVIIHARPPVDDLALRAHADWTYSLLAHELTHTFQLDRVGGIWAPAQALFGRAAPLFPQVYAPSWLLEGIAVFNESALAPGGRLAGTEFAAGIRALAIDSLVPPLDGVSLARPFYPGASSTYLIGSELVTAALARSANDDDADALRQLIDVLGARVIPYRLDATARAVFGAGFSQIHAEWRDSVLRMARDRSARAPTGAPGEVAEVQDRDVVSALGWTARFPRYRGDGSLIWAGDDARRMPGLFERRADGTVARVARRNSVDAAAPFGARRTVYAEFDFTDPYSLRSDLYVSEGRGRRRLTHDARLSAPDAHAGLERVVAVRTTPGATELVTLSVESPEPVVLAPGSPDRVWADPRFSSSGTLVAATLWERGGRTSIVVLDAATGDERARFSPRARTAPRVGAGPRLTVVANPAWIGDSLVVFTSDHEGASAIYRGDARTGAYGPLWSSATSLQTPDVSSDGARIAAVELRGDGFRVVERALPDAPPMQTWLEDAEQLPALEPPVLHAAPDRPYTARTSVGPTWWLPASSTSDLNGTSLGFLTGGRDVVGRHEWRASLLRDLNRSETSGSFAYTYAGFGNPLVELNWQRAWQHAGLFDMSDQFVGLLAERNDALTASVVLTRPRARLSAYAIGAAQVELLHYRTYPSPYLAQLEANGFDPRERVPALIGAIGFSTMQRPTLSVGVQDGIAARFTGVLRPDDAVDGGDSHEVRVSASAAKSLALPGFARHVVALRGAAGIADNGATRDFDVGGVSGGSVELIPGFAFGGVYRDFFVRGVPAGAQRGLRAASASAEYRAPLTRVGRGYRFVPAGLMTMSAVLFGDAGAAWCAAAVAGSPVCEGPIAAREVLASVGAELHLDATLQYDTSYRFRLGIARAVRGDAFTGRGPTIYFTLGETF